VKLDEDGMTPFPALRPIDAFPLEHEGERYICITDPAGYVEAQLLLSPMAFFIATCLYGGATLEQVLRVIKEQCNGLPVAPDQIQALVAHLDEHGFLFSPRFDAIRDRMEGAFREAPVRPAHLAGGAYPAEPEALRAFLNTLLALDAPEVGDVGERPPPPRGLIVPHIDFARGGPTYAAGYRRLAHCQPPDTVIIFGVAHAGAPEPFVLTRKDFDTPLGILETDQEIVAELEAACAWDPFASEAVHRTEHSVEFQAVVLAHLFGSSVKIVPVLCATFCEDPDMQRPGDLPDVARFLEVCRDIAAREDKRVCVIAGADLAHVGRRFGDDFEIDDSVIAGVAARDEEDLAHIAGRAPEDFYASVMKDSNARRVCGLGCIYAVLKTVDGQAQTADLLHYGYAPDPAGGIVSFAALELS